MSPAAPSESAYARAVESAWSRLRGRPVVLSPREFELVAGWRRDGVPLRIVLEVLDHEGRRRGGTAKSLRAVASAVREAASVVASGRTTTVPPRGATAPRTGAIERWRAALESAEHAPLRELLSGLLHDAAQGAPAATLDETLDRDLPLRAPETHVHAASEEARRGLEPFRTRMDTAEHERALRRAVVDRLRDALGLPRASVSMGPRIG